MGRWARGVARRHERVLHRELRPPRLLATGLSEALRRVPAVAANGVREPRPADVPREARVQVRRQADARAGLRQAIAAGHRETPPDYFTRTLLSSPAAALSPPTEAPAAGSPASTEP